VVRIRGRGGEGVRIRGREVENEGKEVIFMKVKEGK
jgi:hypothetical protein